MKLVFTGPLGGTTDALEQKANFSSLDDNRLSGHPQKGHPTHIDSVHLAVSWEQYAKEHDGGGVAVGPAVGTAVGRVGVEMYKIPP